MNLFGIADMQLTRGKVVVDPLHDRKHILAEGHLLIPLSVGGLCLLHLHRQKIYTFLDLLHVLHTHKFMVMFNEVIITKFTVFHSCTLIASYRLTSHAGLVNCKENICIYIFF